MASLPQDGEYYTITDKGYSQRQFCFPLYDFYSAINAKVWYLQELNCRVYATVCFTMHEGEDGYQYIQLVPGGYNDYSCNPDDENGKVSTPNISRYKACFELMEGKGTCTTDYKIFFPHRKSNFRRPKDEGEEHTEFPRSDTYIWAAKQTYTPWFRDDYTGGIVVHPDVQCINTYFDAAGTGKDTWYLKDIFIRYAILDEKDPEPFLDNVKVAPGPHEACLDCRKQRLRLLRG